MSTEKTVVQSRQYITPEEYRELKRSLFDVRCAYAKRLGVTEVRDPAEHFAYLASLEQQIEQLEKEMAHSEVVSEETPPLSASEIINAVVRNVRSSRGILLDWLAGWRTHDSDASDDLTLSWRH